MLRPKTPKMYLIVGKGDLALYLGALECPANRLLHSVLPLVIAIEVVVEGPLLQVLHQQVVLLSIAGPPDHPDHVFGVDLRQMCDFPLCILFDCFLKEIKYLYCNLLIFKGGFAHRSTGSSSEKFLSIEGGVSLNP